MGCCYEAMPGAAPRCSLCRPHTVCFLLCTSIVFLHLPQYFVLWSCLRQHSKGSAPFLSINLHIKEIALCSASVFGVNAKKTPSRFFFLSLLCLVASIHACHSSFIPKAAPSLTHISFFFFCFFFNFNFVQTLVFSCPLVLMSSKCFFFPSDSSMNPPMLRGYD